MFFQRFLALFNTRNKEFMRDRSSVSWNILMPVLIVLGFAFTFTGNFADQYKVGIANDQPHNPALATFRQTKYIEFIPITVKKVIHRLNFHTSITR